MSRADATRARVDRRTKALAERDAQHEGRSAADDSLGAATEAAQETIARHGTLELSASDRAALLEALVQLPEPNPRLRRAFDAERRVVEP